MSEIYRKKTIYEYCRIRGLMVRLEVVQADVRMPDLAHAEVNLIPIGCDRADACRRGGTRCLVFDPDGDDPCPEAWKGEW